MKNHYPVFSEAQLTTKPRENFGKTYAGNYINTLKAVCAFALLWLAPFYSPAKIVFVTTTGAGNHNGLSWANACTISEAAWDWEDCRADGGTGPDCPQGVAACGDTIWLAQGVHRQWSIQGRNGVNLGFNIYGGFAGNETSLSQRNPAVNVTTIADLNANGGQGVINIMTYACSVNRGAHGIMNITLDGITFTNDHFYVTGANVFFNNCIITNFYYASDETAGDLNATNTIFQYGNCLVVPDDANQNFSHCTFKHLSGDPAGVLEAKDVTCSYCTFDSNATTSATNSISAVICIRGSFDHCTFSNSTGVAPGSSAAIGCFVNGINGISNLTVTNSTFTNNNGSDGGAIYTRGPTTVRACSFLNNSATGTGGAISISGAGANLLVENCLFANNRAGTQGGAIYDVAGGGNYYMNTFVNNTATNGSALYTNDVSVNMANNILYQNNGATAHMFVHAYGGGNFTNTSNMSTDGTLGSTANPVLTSDYKLTACSPAIGAGNNTAVDGQTTDLAGNTRIFNSTIDIGCYEFQGNKLATPTISYTNIPYYGQHNTYVCYGSEIDLSDASAISANSYSWYDNGVLDTVTTSSSFLYIPSPGDHVWSVVAHGSCDLLSNTTNLTVGPSLTSPDWGVQTPPNSQLICPGTIVKTTAVPGSGGDNCTTGDTYTYSLDGGTTRHAYNIGDTINTTGATAQVLVYGKRSGCQCSAENVVAAWNLATVTPTVNITASSQLVLSGQGVSFNATATNGGPHPNYQWKQNGQNVGNNSSFFFTNSVNDGDVFSCVLSNVSGFACLGSTTANSNNLVVHLIKDSVSISAPYNCVGSVLTATSTLNAEMLVWWRNGQNIDTVFATWNSRAAVIGSTTKGAPVAVCADVAGNTYVGYKTQVYKYAPGDTIGTLVAGFSQFQIQSLTGIFVDAVGNVYTADDATSYILKWARGSTYGTVAAGIYQSFYSPRGLYVDQSGYVYVVSSWTGTVQRWYPDLSNYDTYGLYNGGGSSAREFQNPEGITVDEQGNMYIADFGNNRIQKWAPGATSGVTVAGGNGAGSAANQLNGPTAVSMDQFGNLFINDSANFRIQMWKVGDSVGVTVVGGNGQGSAFDQLDRPTDSYLDIYGNIYVADKGSDGRVLKFSPTINNTLNTTQDGDYLAIEYPFLSGQTNQRVNVFSNDFVVTPASVAAQVSVTSVTGTQVCPGMGAQFKALALNGGSNPSYQWLLNGNPVGNNSSIYIEPNAQPGDEISCIMASNAICVNPAVDTSSAIALTQAAAAISINLQGGGNTVCQNVPAVFTATADGPQGALLYQWQKNGVNVGTNSTNNIYTDAALQNNDVIRCILTNQLHCANPAIAVSNSIKVSLLTATMGSLPGTTCVGVPLFDTISVAPSQFSWQLNGVNIQSFTAKWEISQTVAGQVLPNTFNEELAGPSGVFVDDSGFVYASARFTNLIQKWSQVDTGASTIYGPGVPPFSPGSNADQFNNPAGIFVDAHKNIYVADVNNNRIQKWAPGATSGVTVAGGNGAGSNANQLFNPTGVFVDGHDNIYVCDNLNRRIQKWQPGASSGITVAGITGQFDAANPDSYLLSPAALYVDAGGDMYIADQNRIMRWHDGAGAGTTIAGNYNNAGSGPDQFDGAVGIWVDGSKDVFVCDRNNNRVQMWLPGATSGITIAGGNGYGNGTFQLASPSAVYADNNGNLFVADLGNNRVQKFTATIPMFPIPAQSDGTYTITATSFNGCTVTSAPFHINPTGAATITISANPSTPVCSSTPVTFTALVSNAGDAPTFKWFRNGSVVSTSINPTYTSTFDNNDIISCSVLSNSPCVQPPFANSNSIQMQVSPVATTSISISANPGNVICSGTSVTFTATAVNGGISPTYVWKRNGVIVGTNAAIYTDAGLDSNDVITCELTSDIICATPTTAISNAITVIVNQTVVPIVALATTSGTSICAGSNATFFAQPINGGTKPHYQWYINSNPVGTDSSKFSTTSFNNNDALVCVMTSNALCANPITASSSTIFMTVTPLVTPSVTLALTDGNQNPCSGTPLTFTATPVNGGNNPLYLFKVNGTSAQVGISATFTSSTLHNNDTINCVITSFAGCLTTSVATSNNVIATVGIPPVITCPLAINLNNDAGFCSSSASIGSATTTGGCGNVTITQTPIGPYPVGNTTVTWKAIDSYGDSSTCTQLVTVTDNEPPTIICPAAVNATADAGHCYASNVTLGTPATHDNCGVQSVTNNAPTQFPVGNTTVIWTVMDIHGNTNTCTQTVNVTDNELPTITCAATVSVTADAGHCYATNLNLGIPVTNDNCGVQSITNDAPAQFAVGNTTVTWTVTDIHGNINTCTQTVTVTDSEGPAINCPASVNVIADAGQCYATGIALGTPMTSDNCGVQNITNNGPAQYAVGTTTVTWVVTDVHGNTNTCAQIVKVTDNQLPTITCPPTVTTVADAGKCYATGVTLGTPVTGDNCGVQSVINNAPPQFAVGNTTVKWIVTDVNGNTNSCNQTVTVTDNQLPVITCPANIAITANQTSCNKPLTILTPATSDNCGVASVNNDFNNTANASGTYPVGTTVVKWTVTDVHSNTNTCTQTVTIYPCISITANTTNTICSGSANGSITLTVTGGQAPFTYHWNGGQTTAGLANVAAGNYTVTVNDAAQGTATALINVGTTIPASKPAVPGAISGLTKFCRNVTNTYSIAAVANATSYAWTVPSNASIQSGQGTTQITVKFLSAFSNGTIGVAAINCKGSSNKSNLSVSLFSTPVKPSSITGGTAVCTGSTQTYVAASVTDAASYTWTIPSHTSIISGQGTNTLMVQFSAGFTGGNLSVSASNCLGNSSVRSLSISPMAVPAKPGSIAGTVSICTGFNYQYQISPVVNATSYTWAVPVNATIVGGQGTNNITVKYNSTFNIGNISVYATNCAGNSSVQSCSISKSRLCFFSKTDETTENDEQQSTTAQEQTNNEFTVVLYPNPFSDQFHLKLSTSGTEPVTIAVYTIDGKLLTEKTEEPVNSDIIMGSGIAAGVYVVQVKQGDRTKVLRLIKSK